MSDDLKQTIRIQRNAKVGTDSHGRSVWTKPIEPTEFELVSTIMLKKILSSGDGNKKRLLQQAADGEDGVLAQDTSSNQFEIITDDELKRALAASSAEASSNRPADVVLEPLDTSSGEELSLVTTQALRKVLGTEDKQTEQDTESIPEDDHGGYNPYDSS